MNNLQTNENQKKNNLVNAIKSKIQIININEHSKPYTSSKYRPNIYNYKNKDIIIICAQNSLNATKDSKLGGNHFPEQFGKKLEQLGFRLFSKIDATPMKKRTSSGGFSTSNVRTRIYVKNVIFQNLKNQKENKPVSYLATHSHPKGNARLFGSVMYENYRHFKQKIRNGLNNENDKLKIIEFKTYKKYYHNHQGIIKTTLVLKYNECLYGLYIINMGQRITQPKISRENSKEISNIEYNININTIKPTCDCNVIKLSPEKKINNNSLNITTNNIGKYNKVTSKTPLLKKEQ